MKIIRNYMYNVGYQIFTLLVPLITTPYITRVLGSTGVGINAYTNSIIQYFILFGSIGVNLYGNRTIASVRDDKEKLSQAFWEIFFLRLITITIAYGVFLIYVLFESKYRYFNFLQSIQILAVIFDISWLFMGLEDFKKTVVRSFIVKIISISSIFIFVKSSEDIGSFILVLGLSTFIGNLSFLTYLPRIVKKPKFKTLNIIKHVPNSLTLFMPQIATQLYLILNKTMLGQMVSVESAGYYEYADKMVKMILAIVTATGTVMLPRMTNSFANKDLEKTKLYLVSSFDFVSFISFPLAAGLAAIAPRFAVWFMGKEFAVTGNLIPILALVIIFIGWSNVLGTQYLLSTNQTKKYSLTVFIGAIANILMNFPLIYFFKTYGAVSSTMISELIVVLCQVLVLRRQLKVSELFKGTWKYLLASLIMFVFVRILNISLSASFMHIFLDILVGVIIYMACAFILKFSFLRQAKEFLKDFRDKRVKN